MSRINNNCEICYVRTVNPFANDIGVFVAAATLLPVKWGSCQIIQQQLTGGMYCSCCKLCIYNRRQNFKFGTTFATRKLSVLRNRCSQLICCRLASVKRSLNILKRHRRAYPPSVSEPSSRSIDGTELCHRILQCLNSQLLICDTCSISVV